MTPPRQRLTTHAQRNNDNQRRPRKTIAGPGNGLDFMSATTPLLPRHSKRLDMVHGHTREETSTKENKAHFVTPLVAPPSSIAVSELSASSMKRANKKNCKQTSTSLLATNVPLHKITYHMGE
ncbi:hypothetical protein C8J57DRAFT_1222783 [Mycena rebaudengoi]|nr:hypothetical protein C8J57DRAFT_1222783 [Mycena rebaudengoi]